MAAIATEGDSKPSLPRAVRSARNKVAAARLRVAVDKQRGVPTPKWIRDLAENKPAERQ